MKFFRIIIFGLLFIAISKTCCVNINFRTDVPVYIEVKDGLGGTETTLLMPGSQNNIDAGMASIKEIKWITPTEERAYSVSVDMPGAPRRNYSRNAQILSGGKIYIGASNDDDVPLGTLQGR